MVVIVLTSLSMTARSCDLISWLLTCIFHVRESDAEGLEVRSKRRTGLRPGAMMRFNCGMSSVATVMDVKWNLTWCGRWWMNESRISW